MSEPQPPQESGLFSIGWLWRLPFGGAAEKSPRQAFEELNTPVSEIQLLDVRSSKEWSESHILGALSIPIAEFRSKLDGLRLDPEETTLAICLSAHRSIPAVRLLKRHGFRDVAQLAGGMKAWRQQRLPETTP